MVTVKNKSLKIIIRTICYEKKDFLIEISISPPFKNHTLDRYLHCVSNQNLQLNPDARFCRRNYKDFVSHAV